MTDRSSHPPVIEYARPPAKPPVWVRVGLLCGPVAIAAGIIFSSGLEIIRHGWSGRTAVHVLIAAVSIGYMARDAHQSVVRKKHGSLRNIGLLLLLLGAGMGVAVALGVRMGNLVGYRLVPGFVLLCGAAALFYSGWSYLWYYWQVRREQVAGRNGGGSSAGEADRSE